MYTGRVFNKNLFNMKTNILMGYYQSFKYFQHIRSELIEVFTLSDEVEASIKSRILAINIHLQRVLMIHIRREDTLVEGNDWTGLLSIDYYKKAMEKIDAKNKCVLVFSDDIAWCKRQPLFENCNFIDEPDPVITVRMMQYCDDFIIAGSTLSWWGAWLSQSKSKRIIAPFPFYKKVDEQHDTDLIPDDWETLNSKFSDIDRA